MILSISYDEGNTIGTNLQWDFRLNDPNKYIEAIDFERTDRSLDDCYAFGFPELLHAFWINYIAIAYQEAGIKPLLF